MVKPVLTIFWEVAIILLLTMVLMEHYDKLKPFINDFGRIWENFLNVLGGVK